MEQMRELLKARIAQVKDPVQKILLQDVLADVFGELLTYTDSCFASLEEKIDGELQLPEPFFDIYTGVCTKDGLDAASRCLFPVLDMIKAGESDDGEFSDGLPYKEGLRPDGFLGTMFLACQYPDVQSCMLHPHQAEVETENGKIQTAVRLAYSRPYQQLLRWMYLQFGENQRQWHTVNCPFLYKMLDIIDVEGAVPADAVVVKIAIDLGGLTDFVSSDAVLVWNVSKELYNTRAKMGAADGISFYEHQVPLQDLESGYLAVLEKKEPFTAVFSKEGLCLRTQREAQGSLELLKFHRMDMRRDQTVLLHALQTNHRNAGQADRLAARQSRFVWTKGEVSRMLHAYEAFHDFELEDICPDMPGELPAIDLNPFIQTHSMLKSKRKMALILHPKDSSDIFQYEKMFFLLAELQLCTEELEWTGIIRE